MKARRKSDGKIIEVEEVVYNLKNGKPYHKCLSDGHHYPASDLDFNVDPEETVISGWVAIDEAFNQCFLHTEKPIQKAQPIADTGDYDTVWDSDGETYLLDAGLFPDMDSDSEPQECEIIIKRKKNE